MDDTQISEAVVEEVRRLGGSLDPYSPESNPTMPRAFRQLTHDLRLPDFVDVGDGYDRALSWVPGSNYIEGYAVEKTGPWIVLMSDANYSMLIARLDDPSPTDPTVYWLDHDDFSVVEPHKLGALSEWLSDLILSDE